jgi:hypothetical protein
MKIKLFEEYEYKGINILDEEDITEYTTGDFRQIKPIVKKYVIYSKSKIDRQKMLLIFKERDTIRDVSILSETLIGSNVYIYEVKVILLQKG